MCAMPAPSFTANPSMNHGRVRPDAAATTLHRRNATMVMERSRATTSSAALCTTTRTSATADTITLGDGANTGTRIPDDGTQVIQGGCGLWGLSLFSHESSRAPGFQESGGFPIGRQRKSSVQDSDMEKEFQDGKEEVIQAWYMDDSEEDQRLPHHREPKEFIPLTKLSELGILSWRLNADDWENDENLKKIREARGYSYMDICDVCPEKLPNYEAKLKNFFEEHLHTDEEIRYSLEGSGYFDVRDQNDQWIRVAVKKGGMIVLPAGMYHRFTLDSENYIKAMRLFVGEPVWTPYNRPHDHLPARLPLAVSEEQFQDFRKIDPDRWEFANDGFLRGQRHLLKMIKRRRPLPYLPASQQQALGTCLVVGQFGSDEEIDVLKHDKNILLAEVAKLRQEQQSTKANMQAMEERLQHAEQKQLQVMGFLARAMQNPDFFHRLIQQQDKMKGLEGAFSKKRTRSIDIVPFLCPGEVSQNDQLESTFLFEQMPFAELNDEPGMSELENLALNIQGLGKGKQSSTETKLTDDFWEELLNEGTRDEAGISELERRRPSYVDALAQKLGYLSNCSQK
ncbi:hypothetical protein ABZP36_005670 [Zizania latifolia]